jgi:hypothetical protein
MVVSIVLASRDCMSKECAPTIELRIRISRFDANKRCKVSNQTIRLSARSGLQHVPRIQAHAMRLLMPGTRPGMTTKITNNAKLLFSPAVSGAGRVPPIL